MVSLNLADEEGVIIQRLTTGKQVGVGFVVQVDYRSHPLEFTTGIRDLKRIRQAKLFQSRSVTCSVIEYHILWRRDSHQFFEKQCILICFQLLLIQSGKIQEPAQRHVWIMRGLLLIQVHPVSNNKG